MNDNRIQVHNFNDISNILTSNGDSGGLLVSKLKKMPKTQVKDLMRTNPGLSKKKVVINSNLEMQKEEQ